MQQTRRDLAGLLPALLSAAGFEAEAFAANTLLPSKSYEFNNLKVQVNPTNHNQSRQVLNGLTHEKFPIDLHITELAPGQMPHAAHHHVYEEMILVQSGRLEVYIKGETTQAGPGSVVYVASNDEHGWKNVGDVPSQYFVLALGHHSSA